MGWPSEVGYSISSRFSGIAAMRHSFPRRVAGSEHRTRQDATLAFIVARLDDPPDRRRGRIAGVGRARGLDEQEVDLLPRHGTMLDTFGHHEQLARSQMDLAVAQLDREMALEHEEEVVRVVVLVPDELALDLDHHHVMSVELGYRAGLPVLGKCRQLRFEVYLAHLLKPPKRELISR